MLMISGPGRIDGTARVSAATDAADRPADAERPEPARPAGTPRPEAAAAVPPDRKGPMAGVIRPFAPFLAQLIAGALGLPQSRVRRRSAPGEAASAYRRGVARPVAGAIYRASA